MSNLTLLAPVRVVSFSKDRRPVAPPAPVPEVGAAWGSSAKFDYSLQPYGASAEISNGSEGAGGAAGDGDGFKVTYPPRDQLIRGVEEFRETTLETIPLGGDAVEVEGNQFVTFYTGTQEIRHEERKVRGAYTSI